MINENINHNQKHGKRYSYIKADRRLIIERDNDSFDLVPLSIT